MSIPIELKPTRNQRVMDLLVAAGVNVSDWGNFKGGQKKASSNPRYCYEWSFVEENKYVVLNLWYTAILEANGVICYEIDFRKSAPEDIRGVGKSTWERRAKKFDEAIQASIKNNIPIRVIVNDGIRRSLQPPGSGASKVKSRLLDPMSWSVTAYDRETGIGTISRGILPSVYMDQFEVKGSPSEPERRPLTGEAFVRKPDVRHRTLFRAKGKCEWCSTEGFKMANGKIYLETHHVIPLSEDGLDNDSNVVALCPNHHREAHFGINAVEIRAKLLDRIQKLNA